MLASTSTSLRRRPQGSSSRRRSSPPRPPPCDAARRVAPPAGEAHPHLNLHLPATPPAGKDFPPATVLPACSGPPSTSSSLLHRPARREAAPSGEAHPHLLLSYSSAPRAKDECMYVLPCSSPLFPFPASILCPLSC